MIRRLGLVLALAGLVAAAGAAPAGAHAVLEATTPARGAALDAAPRQVVLRFSEAVEVEFGSVRVFDAAGREVQDGAAFHPDGEARAVAERLRGGLGDGGYTATYRVVSADSHPVSGGFVFGVGDGGAAAVGALAILMRAWLPALVALAAPRPAGREAASTAQDGPGWEAASVAFAARWRRLLAAAAALGLASALAGLPLQAATAAGTTFWDGLGEIGTVLGTRFGTVWGLGALAWAGVLAAAVAGRARAELTVEPALAGPNEVHLYLFDRADGAQWDETKEMRVSAALPAQGIEPIELPVRRAGPGHYAIGGAPLAPAGAWTLELVARVSEFDEHRARFAVPVE